MRSQDRLYLARQTASRLSPAVLVVALVGGCISYHPRPLSPADTARNLEERTLTNDIIKAFLERNLERELTNWPVQSWDFELLTLAAFYYQPSLEVARADWQVARGGVRSAAERPNPTVTASGAYEPAPDAFSPWIPAINFDLPIETAGKRRWRTEQARHVSEAARLNVAAAAWQVRSQVRLALLETVAAQKRADLLKQQLALRQELADRLERQFEAGAISAFERNTARLALLRARADLQDAQRLEAEARPRLAAAIGVPVAALDGLRFDLDLAGGSRADALTTHEARQIALLGRADVLSALTDYAASQSALQLEVAKQYPDVHLSPGYSWNAGSAGEHDWQLGVNVQLPVFNRHQGPIAEAAARREASAARFIALQAKVIGEIETAVASFQASRSNVVVLERLVAAQTAQQRTVQAQLQAGAVDRLELLNAELELNTAALARLDAQVKLQQALGALEDAVQHPFELPTAIFETRTPEP